jgi:hypothetical protein
MVDVIGVARGGLFEASEKELSDNTNITECEKQIKKLQ